MLTHYDAHPFFVFIIKKESNELSAYSNRENTYIIGFP